MPANPILAVNDVVEMTYKATSLAEAALVINRNYWKVLQTAGTPLTTLDDARVGLSTRWQATIMVDLAQDYFYHTSQAKRVSGMNFPINTNLIYDSAVQGIESAVGGAAAPCLPSFLTMSAWLRTGFVGRWWRGGIRMGPFARAAADTSLFNTNKLTAAAHASIQALCVNYRQDLVLPGGSTIRLIVLSPTFWFVESGGLGSAADNSAEVFGVLVSRYVKTQNTRQAPHVP